MLHDKIKEMMSDHANEPDFLNINGMLIMKEFSQSDIVGFYFDDTFNKNFELYNTAQDFFANGFSKMPFKHCFFSFPRINKGYDERGEEYLNYTLNIFCKQHEDGKISILQVGKDNYSGLIATVHNDGRRMSFYPITNQIGTKQQIEISRTTLMDIGNIVLTALLLLNHPVYEQESHMPNDKMQKSRERRGKSPLSKYIYIKMKKEYRDAIEKGGGDIRKPHWRRGHIRHLQDGRIIPVSPCLVNFDGDPLSTDAPKPKTYVVKS